LKGDAKPIRAIRELFKRQSELAEGFRLLITCNVRVKDQGELDRVLRDIEGELDELGVEVGKTIQWYLGKTVDWKMKVWLPRTLDTLATAFRFSLQDFRALKYEGTGGSFMIHFVLGFRYDPSRSTGKSLSPLALLAEPLYYIKGNRIAKVQEEPPAPKKRP
jgi:hypothetical protein